MTDEDSIQGLGVTIVMAVGFLVKIEEAEEISAEEQACNVVCWYDDVTELFVMDVVDLDLCHDFGLVAVFVDVDVVVFEALFKEEDDGPVKPNYKLLDLNKFLI